MGNRIVKIVKSGENEDEWQYTYYARDASGQTMAVYNKTYIVNFTHIIVQPAIDSQKSEYRLHFRGNVEGTKYLLDHKLDTAKTIK